MFYRTRGLLHTHRRLRNYQQGAKSSFHHLSCGDALFHAPELSRLRNARRARAELSSLTRLHSIAGGSGAQILLGDPNWNAGDGAIRMCCCRGWSMTADALHETVNLTCARRRGTVVASLDAKLEASLVRDRRRRNSRLRLHARRPETPRSIAKAYRDTSRNVKRREKTTSSRINDPNWQEHGWPRWMSLFARRKSGRRHLPRIPALRDGRSHKTPR